MWSWTLTEILLGSVIIIDVSLLDLLEVWLYLTLSLFWIYMHLNAFESDNTAWNKALLLSCGYLKRDTPSCATKMWNTAEWAQARTGPCLHRQCQNNVSIPEVTLFLYWGNLEISKPDKQFGLKIPSDVCKYSNWLLWHIFTCHLSSITEIYIKIICKKGRKLREWRWEKSKQ